MAESIAYRLFKEYTGENAADILSGLPSTQPRTFESTWREFKSGYVKDDDFNGIWSEVLGAFANTRGGVVVWGIYANTVPGSHIDAAVNIQFVMNPDEFTTRLKKALKDAIKPPLQEVEIQPVLMNDGSGRGFVVCHIPEGIAKPYESMHSRKRFMGRFDDRCEELPTALLLQLPSSRKNQLFKVTLDPTVRPHQTIRTNVLDANTGRMEPATDIWFDLIFTNAGDTTLDNAYISVESPGFVFWQWKVRDEIRMDMENIVFPKRLRSAIHPGTSDELRLICAAIDLPAEAIFTITAYARDITPKVANLTLALKNENILFPHYHQKIVTEKLQ